ncbi:hypothetical protein T492DRAFT_844992 [Pavlovales sp. CCMP2436]|nr:hypothetical protein T492DRAFT_844992 [Pavlovales sp. CCMP2436]
MIVRARARYRQTLDGVVGQAFPEKLAALERWCDEHPGERIIQKTEMATEWDNQWKVGLWMCNCRLDNTHVPKAQRKAFEAAVGRSGYGKAPYADKVAALERWCNEHPGEKMTALTKMETAWDTQWKVGLWIKMNSARVPGDQRDKFDAAVQRSKGGTVAALERWCGEHPGQKMMAVTKMETAWDKQWAVGNWCRTKGTKVPEEQRPAFEAAVQRSNYYGRKTAKRPRAAVKAPMSAEGAARPSSVGGSGKRARSAVETPAPA